jgi:hypothetical protein
VTSLNWSVIEVGTAIACTSLSALRPLASRWLPTLFSHFSQPTQEVSGTTLNNSAVKLPRYKIPARSVSFSGTYVARSCDVSELTELPARPVMPERTKSNMSDMHMRTLDLFERSSEEVLVAQKSRH